LPDASMISPPTGRLPEAELKLASVVMERSVRHSRGSNHDACSLRLAGLLIRRRSDRRRLPVLRARLEGDPNGLEMENRHMILLRCEISLLGEAVGTLWTYLRSPDG
jgi:hypothetical protein